MDATGRVGRGKEGKSKVGGGERRGEEAGRAGRVVEMRGRDKLRKGGIAGRNGGD